MMKKYVRYIFVLALMMGMWYALSLGLMLVSMASTVGVLAGLFILFGGIPLMAKIAWDQVTKIVMVMVLAAGLVGCTRISPGYVGIKVNQWFGDSIHSESEKLV